MHVGRIVCSDAMARGMDLEDVEAVINYDAPSFIKTYIHRVGRTARAGREGSAFTLVTQEENDRFVEVRNKAAKSREIQQMNVTSEQIAALIPDFTVRNHATLRVAALHVAQGTYPTCCAITTHRRLSRD